MTDHFALFNETPHPWIEPEALRERFLALSAQVHPDRLHQAPDAERRAAGEDFARLNAAYNCLRDPKERLRHLLELKLGAKPADVQRIPPALMDFFFEVGRLCQAVDAYLDERRKVTSPILKMQFIEPTMEWVDKINGFQRTILSRQEELYAELKVIDGQWRGVYSDERSASLPRLEEIYRLLGYFTRWSEQLRERVVQLSL